MNDIYKSFVFPNGCVDVTLEREFHGVVNKVAAWHMNTKEEMTRAALIKLGWTPPPQWISVKDRLPELGVAVLVTDGTTQSTAERRNPYTHEDKDGIRWRCNVVSGFEWDWELDEDYRDQSPITHWMPLPKPPEPA